MNKYCMNGKLIHKASDHNTQRCEVEKWVFLPHSDFERLKANPYQEHEANVCCTTFEQTINDMLSDFENTDEMALTEALSNYYYSHNESFDGLNIKPENRDTFEQLKQPVIDYYGG